MEETAKKITDMKTKSLRLSEQARELMKTAKSEQKKIRTRGLCILGNKVASYLGVRDIEAHQRFFETICEDKKQVDKMFLAAVENFICEYNESLKNHDVPAQTDIPSEKGQKPTMQDSSTESSLF